MLMTPLSCCVFNRKVSIKVGYFFRGNLLDTYRKYA